MIITYVLAYPASVIPQVAMEAIASVFPFRAFDAAGFVDVVAFLSFNGVILFK